MKKKFFGFRLGAMLFALCLPAEAQQPAKIPRIGYLALRSEISLPEKAFWQAMRKLGYVEGQNIVVERATGKGKLDRLPELAAELVRKEVDVIVVQNVQSLLAAKKATQTIPVVFAIAQEPVGVGLVASLARPGGNVTGVTDFARELAGKRVELLKETAPELSRLAVLSWRPAGPDYVAERREIESAVQALRLELHPVEVRGPDDLKNVFSAMTRENAKAFIGLTDTRFARNRKQIIELGAKHRLLTVYPDRVFAEAGGLMSYGTNRIQWRRRLAVYVDKILKGAKPANLPVEQPTEFELVINFKAAKQIGLTIPPEVLYRADRVIR